MRRRTPIVGALLLSAGVTPALVGGGTGAEASAAPAPTAETLATMPHLVPGQVLDLGGGVTAGVETEQVPLAALTTNPECYPNGTERKVYWIRYQFDDENIPGLTAGSARVDGVTNDDCYQITGGLRDSGTSKLMQTDLTTIGQTDFDTPYFPADGVYEWHKYRSDQSQADGGIALPHGMHSFKRTAIFTYHSNPADFSHHITMGLDTYAGVADYVCWFRDDVEPDGTPNVPRGEGCFYI